MELTPLPPLDSLRCFLEVAQRLNFRAAARAVHLTPAAVSARIRQLEDLVERPLFRRTTRRVELTDAGAALVPAAAAALAAAADAVRSARGEKGPPPLDLTVGTRHELGMSWVLPALPALRRALPHVTFHLYVGSGDDLVTRVAQRALPCAVGSMKTADPRVSTEPLHEERYVLVGAGALLKRQPVRSEAQLKQHTLVDADAALPLASYLTGAEGGAQVSFGRVVSMGTIAAVREVVLRGEGVAVLPQYLVAPDLKRGRLVRLLPRRPLLSDWFRLYFRTGDERTPLFTTMAQVLRSRPLT